MFISTSAFASGSFLTAANISVINQSAQWGVLNPPQLTDMGLSSYDIESVEEAVSFELPLTESAAVNAFKLVYAADRNTQLSRGAVNDTLARLTLMAGPQLIGSSVRRLDSYPQFAEHFKFRFRDIVSLAHEISLLTYVSEELDTGVDEAEVYFVQEGFVGSVGHGDIMAMGISEAVEMAISDRSGSLMDLFQEEGLDGWHLVRK